MAYVSIHFAMRSGNWNLRTSSFEAMAPPFTAFDHHTYEKLIADHLADLLCMPPSVLATLQQGAFVVNINGRPWHVVGIDEAH